MLQIKKSFKDLSSKIYVVGTPIGNLSDFSFRAIEILKTVDKIYCEDTRISKILLENYKIKNNLESLHKFNEAMKFDTIIEELGQNKNLAIISDAGVPCISDPGSKIINKLIKNNIGVNIIPVNCGPAFIHAFVMSGFESKAIEFLGFLDKKSQQIKKTLLAASNFEDKVICFYESVHRIISTLNLIKTIFNDEGRIALVREITKINEEIVIGTIAEVCEFVNSPNFVQKGEFVVLIDKNIKRSTENKQEIDYQREVEKLIDQGNSRKDAIKKIAKKYGLNKNLFFKENYKKCS